MSQCVNAFNRTVVNVVLILGDLSFGIDVTDEPSCEVVFKFDKATVWVVNLSD